MRQKANDVHAMIEKYPLARVAEAYEQMHSGKARFRVVLMVTSSRYRGGT